MHSNMGTSTSWPPPPLSRASNALVTALATYKATTLSAITEFT